MRDYREAFAGIIAEHYAKPFIARHFKVLESDIVHGPGSPKDRTLGIDFQMFTEDHGDMMIDLKTSLEHGSSICVDADHPIFHQSSIEHGDRWIGCLFSKSMTLHLVRASEELKHIAEQKNGREYCVVHELDVESLPDGLVERIALEAPFGEFFESEFGESQPWTKCQSKSEVIALASSIGERICGSMDIPA